MDSAPAPAATTAPACQVTGADGCAQWHPIYGDAWVGLLQTHRQLTRELDAQLEAEHGLSLSGLELLARLASAPAHWLRLSALASQTGLSLSRVSRIVDALESRSLLERRPCPSDARAINAHLTTAGAELLGAAEQTHRAAVQQSFFDRLSATEVETLAAVFGRFAPGAAAACPKGPVLPR
ncbi:MAG: MarR family transcriptional regulator [Solirubrobacteraceae bacterium]|jgi:DNA-binding MarR family transcriptional regulator